MYSYLWDTTLAQSDSLHWSGGGLAHVSFAMKLSGDTLTLTSDVNLYRQPRPYYARWIFHRLPRDEDFLKGVWLPAMERCVVLS